MPETYCTEDRGKAVEVSILYWRCINRDIRRFRIEVDIGFNSLLEMHTPSRGQEAEPSAEDRFNSLLEMRNSFNYGITRYFGDRFNSLLEMQQR